MADNPAQGVALLVGLMAAQFLVHAAGWAMTAAMQHRAAGPEGHFAAFWAAVALALALQFVPGWPGAWRPALADLLYIGAALVVHRGVLCFFRQPLPDRLYLAVVAATLLLLGLSLALDSGRRPRVAGVSLLIGGTCAALGWTFWLNGRRRTRFFTGMVAALAGLAAAVLLGYAGLTALAPADGAVDAPAALNTTLAIALFFVAGIFNLAQIQLVLGRVLQHLVAQTQLDPLTGVANRRGFMAALDGVHRRAVRSGAHYGLLMVDIDHFKRINDEQGHAAGDAALQQVARQLAAGVRVGDSVGRLGGEEFCLLLPGCDGAGAEALAQRVCAAVAASQPLTVSIGVALVDAAAESSDDALARADAALYRAKREGRNRVVAALPL